MTISVSSSSITIAGTGALSTFTFPFVAGSASNVQVIYTNAVGAQTTLTSNQYTLGLNAAAPGAIWGVGGSVTYPTDGSFIAAGTSITIQRVAPLTQLTSISNQGSFYPQAVEGALDTLCMQIQDVSASISGISPTGKTYSPWVTGVSYNYGDMVVDGANGANTGNWYACQIANVGGTWATDLSAGKWALALNVQAFTLRQGALYLASSSGSPSSPTVGTGQGQIAIGDSATVVGSNAGAIALGTSNASGAYSFAAGIGTNSAVYGALGTNCIALGLNAKASNTYSVALQGGVASGSYSFAFSFASLASGNYSAALCGGDATNTCALAFGIGSAASGTYSFAFGSYASASGAAAVAVGEACAAAGSGSSAFGRGAKSASLRQFVHGNQRVAQGDCQTSIFELSADTSSATPTIALLDWGGSHEISVPSDTAWTYEVVAVASNLTNKGKVGAFKNVACGIVMNNGGTVTGTAASGLNAPNSALGGWSGGSIAMSISGTSLRATVTAPNTDHIVWAIKVTTIEVS